MPPKRKRARIASSSEEESNVDDPGPPGMSGFSSRVDSLTIGAEMFVNNGQSQSSQVGLLMINVNKKTRKKRTMKPWRVPSRIYPRFSLN